MAHQNHLFPADKKLKKQDIVAAQKIIADISSGVYRSPAAALKELVSNAYDADATKVTIATDAPHFRTLVIEDNGTGMTIEKFLQVITHIGGSRKRLDSDVSDVFHRRLIGRIGIGMLAVAQLGNRFYVSSTVRGSKKRFTAEVNLEPFHREDAALKNMAKIDLDGKVQIGAVRYVDELPEAEDVHYTVITVPDAKKGLISEMTSAVRKAVGAQEALVLGGEKLTNFANLIETVRAAQRADLVLDGYYYMLWELALLAPLNYLSNGPFDQSRRNIEGAAAFKPPHVKNFQLLVDGTELFRPQLFPNTKAFNYPSPDPKLYLLDYDKQLAGRRLRFTGYVYTQQPRIHPEEFKGVHIRIRDVGIGKYDKSWLGYPFDEGIKFGQVTGEVYVEDGLEPALNIDRDSFRETDVHYQAMRAYIWDLLRTKIFPDFKSRSKKFSDAHKATEVKFVALLRTACLKGWRCNPAVPGKPDFIFRKDRLAIFVDGCYWHGCPKHCRMPQSSTRYGQQNISKNKRRDLQIRRALRQAGWRVLRIWEHDLRKRPALCLRRISTALCSTAEITRKPNPTNEHGSGNRM